MLDNIDLWVSYDIERVCDNLIPSLCYHNTGYEYKNMFDFIKMWLNEKEQHMFYKLCNKFINKYYLIKYKNINLLVKI